MFAAKGELECIRFESCLFLSGLSNPFCELCASLGFSVLCETCRVFALSVTSGALGVELHVLDYEDGVVFVTALVVVSCLSGRSEHHGAAEVSFLVCAWALHLLAAVVGNTDHVDHSSNISFLVCRFESLLYSCIGPFLVIFLVSSFDVSR